MLQQPMHAPTCRTYDIPQAYEEVKTGKLLADVDYLLRNAERCGSALQQVFRMARSITCPARSLHKGMPDRVVVASKTLKRAISLI